MRLHTAAAFVCAALCALALVSCSSDASSGTRAPALVPSSVQQGSVADQAGAVQRPPAAVRRTQSAPNCSGIGPQSFVGGTDGNVAKGTDAVVGGGHSNKACDSYAAIAGGYSNVILATSNSLNEDGFIGGGNYNLLNGTDGDSGILAGAVNTVTGYASGVAVGTYNTVGDAFAFIGSGSYNSIPSGADHSAIGSGYGNTVSAEYGFLGGGNTNKVSGEYAFVGAGLNNTASGEGAYIAAGGYNTASGEGAVIDGGFNSAAAGTFATIPGGYVNSAAGTYSFAAGARASAAQTGTFVWSDGSDGDAVLTSTKAYQFLARASGGFTFYTNAGSTVGAQLAAGSGTWASLSDRNAKTNILPLDDATVLEKVAALPVSRWSYKTERGVRHAGPMAQDFYAAFGLGEDDRHITSIDEDGVALAAIKALHARVQALDARNAAQAATIASMQRELHVLSAQMAALRSRRD